MVVVVVMCTSVWRAFSNYNCNVLYDDDDDEGGSGDDDSSDGDDGYDDLQ